MYGRIGKMIAVAGQRDALAAILVDGTGTMPGSVDAATTASTAWLIVTANRFGCLAKTDDQNQPPRNVNSIKPGFGAWTSEKRTAAASGARSRSPASWSRCSTTA